VPDSIKILLSRTSDQIQALDRLAERDLVIAAHLALAR
jgi:hypothetical protein